MTYRALNQRVSNRGFPPDSFLDELIKWGKGAPEEIFTPNDVPVDIYTVIKPELGPWKSPIHRRAALLEAMRVHAGFEASWKWGEGVDVTNKTSMAHITGQETGIFQVSFDSTYLGGLKQPMKAFAKNNGIETPPKFISKMKTDHALALTYYARLVRVNIQWAGPLKRREINKWLRRDAVEEFIKLLKAA